MNICNCIVWRPVDSIEERGTWFGVCLRFDIEITGSIRAFVSEEEISSRLARWYALAI